VGRDGLLRWQAGKMKKNWKEPMGFNGARAELRWTEKEEKIIVFAIF
jgi:hypothetical protein